MIVSLGNNFSQLWGELPTPVQIALRVGVVYKIHSLILTRLFRSFYSLSPNGDIVAKRNLGIKLPQFLRILTGCIDLPPTLIKLPSFLYLRDEVTTVLAAPLSEELYYRSFLQEKVLSMITENTALKVGISSLIFASIHTPQFQMPMSVLPQFLMGLTYGFVTTNWGVREAILLHAINNLSLFWLYPKISDELRGHARPEQPL